MGVLLLSRARCGGSALSALMRASLQDWWARREIAKTCRRWAERRAAQEGGTARKSSDVNWVRDVDAWTR